MNELESKQDELIAHYEIKPIVSGMSPTKEWNDWYDKKYQLLDEIVALKRQREPVSADFEKIKFDIAKVLKQL